MKQCPSCGTTYTDETLSFCLSDGTALVSNDEEATFVRSGTAQQNIKTASYPAAGQMRVDIPQPTVASPPPAYAAPAGDSTSWVKIVAVVGIVGVMIIGAAVIAGALIYFNKDARPSVTANNANNGSRSSPTPTPAATPTVANNETNELREQIANLEKRLNEQKNANRAGVNVPPPPPDQPAPTRTIATVNSPGDGFLALRTMPSSSAGDRLLAIPHGARVTINGCLGSTRVGNKTGRWCRASYGGYSGWVFDAWLNY